MTPTTELCLSTLRNPERYAVPGTSTTVELDLFLFPLQWQRSAAETGQLTEGRYGERNSQACHVELIAAPASFYEIFNTPVEPCRDW